MAAKAEKGFFESILDFITQLFSGIFDVWNKKEPTPASTPSRGGIGSLFHSLFNAVSNVRLTSNFGMRTDPVKGGAQNHHGLDIAAPLGSEIKAPAAGTVEFAGANGGYGNEVIINHGNGLRTIYGHLKDFFVKAGDKISLGQIFAKVGSTGKSTGPHVHLGAELDGAWVNPLSAFAL